MMGRSIYFFFNLSRRYHEHFSPITSRTALPRRSGIQEKRKRNLHHNYGIKEHDISYFGAKREISFIIQ